VTATEAYELITQGGTTDFVRLIRLCESFGPYCLIGGLAVNCYVEPVYTLDADVVIIAETLPDVIDALKREGFAIEEYAHSFNATSSASDLRIPFTTDERYQAFLNRAVDADVLGVRTRIASLTDLTQGKLWAYSDPQRRLSKRKNDELDLIRLAETYPQLITLYPAEIAEQMHSGSP
jgi:hypothetical protein